MKGKFKLSAIFIFSVFLSASFATQISAAVVINEVYGAGGNAGATYNRDYVELYNNGTTDVDISGYSLQYNPATGTGTYTVCTITATDTVIEPGTYFLIQLGSENTAVGSAIPTPNATPTCNTNIAAGAGKLALVTTTAQLTGGVCPPTGATIVDFVGYGTTANCFEGAGRAPTTTATLSIQRTPVGIDTNNNNIDFQSGAPTPQAAGTTAAPAVISGRVTIGSRGISRQMVMLSGGDLDEPIYTTTNLFGNYKFEDLSVGETYVVQLVTRRYRFANPSIVISLQDNVTNADFVAQTK